MSGAQDNPFAQPAYYWKVSFVLPQAAIATAENSFEGIAMAQSAFEIDEKSKLWNFDLLCAAMPDMTEIRRRLLVLSALFDVPTPIPDMQQVHQQDWLAAVAKSFPPMTIGRFYVHGEHGKLSIPKGLIPIQVDAGAAFGSGEHGTTRTCLEAFEWLSRKREFTRILDMGCGSGILAIAAAKLWRTEIMAADIDAVAVRVTNDNARINKVNMQVTALVSDGYTHERIRKSGPYDLIVSNILARPLVAFAPDLKANLAAGGVAVLSGLLTSQEQMVMRAHRAQKLNLVKRFTDGEWCTLVLE